MGTKLKLKNILIKKDLELSDIAALRDEEKQYIELNQSIEAAIKENACITSLEHYLSFLGIKCFPCFFNNSKSIEFVKKLDLNINTEHFVIVDMEQLSQSSRYGIKEIFSKLKIFCSVSNMTGYLARTYFLIYFM